MTKTVPGCATKVRLRNMSEREFMAAWIAAVGEPPAVMLDRGPMVDLLLDAMRHAGEPGCGNVSGD